MMPKKSRESDLTSCAEKKVSMLSLRSKQIYYTEKSYPLSEMVFITK